MSIDFAQAQPLNGARFERADGGLLIETHPGSGSFSGLLPAEPDAQTGPREFVAVLHLDRGAISIAAVTPQLQILSERFFFEPGTHELAIAVPDTGGVTALLIRNAAVDDLPSTGKLLQVVVRARSTSALFLPGAKPTRQITLPLRRRYSAIGGTEIAPLQGGHPETDAVTFWTSACAAVVIDAWADHECPGWYSRAEENMRDFLQPALAALRNLGIRLIHAAHDRPTHPLAKPQPDEAIVQGSLGSAAIAAELRAAGIRTLFYLGYKSNRCVMSRAIGAMPMRSEGFDIVLVRDASIALENSDTFASKQIHAAMIDLFEGAIGASVATADLVRAAGGLSDG
ncbi:MAG: hypothetical protein QOD74_141 [Variibacter sp.]|jgi:nicotinamidase-related amidase|nr:hypothetical protein [Variibacter sp.]